MRIGHSAMAAVPFAGAESLGAPGWEAATGENPADKAVGRPPESRPDVRIAPIRSDGCEMTDAEASFYPMKLVQGGEAEFGGRTAMLSTGRSKAAN